MWKVTLVLNAVIMAVFSYGSSASQIKLANQYIQYPHVGEGMPPLPLISDLALRAQWMPKTVALAWLTLTLGIMMLNWRRQDTPGDVVQMHTSATLLVGMVMLGFFIIAGVYPYIAITVHLR